MIYIITNATDNLAQIAQNGKDFWDYFSILSTFLLSCATITVAARQYYISKQQKDIALYDKRYKKLYKNILETINKLEINHICRGSRNIAELQKIFNRFYEDMNYSRFLIKDKDFTKINRLFEEVSEKIKKHYNNTYTSSEAEIDESYRNLDSFLKLQKKKIVDILTPYLYIEKDDFYVIICKKIKKICKNVNDYLGDLLDG